MFFNVEAWSSLGFICFAQQRSRSLFSWLVSSSSSSYGLLIPSQTDDSSFLSVSSLTCCEKEKEKTTIIDERWHTHSRTGEGEREIERTSCRDMMKMMSSSSMCCFQLFCPPGVCVWQIYHNVAFPAFISIISFVLLCLPHWSVPREKEGMILWDDKKL